jgi:ribonuclease/clavin/mitogillin
MRERRPSIVNVGYRSTNYWVISVARSRLLVDLGWPGTMGMLRARLARSDVPLSEIRCAVATHYHIDHAGLAQELKDAGVPLLVLEPKASAIPLMKRWTKPADRYVELRREGNILLPFARTRSFLEGIGIRGEILSTPGHSDDSISVLLDDGSVFTGDLTPPDMATPGQAGAVASSWRLLREHGAIRIHPGHGPVRLMEANLTG